MVADKGPLRERNRRWLPTWFSGKAGRVVVSRGRFELPTCGLGNRRSIQLSYRDALSAQQSTTIICHRQPALRTRLGGHGAAPEAGEPAGVLLKVLPPLNPTT